MTPEPPQSLEEACEALPVFPLPSAVLMPETLLPLHVFEPRYQALVAHCMNGDRRLGIATLKPGFQEDYEGQPACHPEIGIGEIVRLETFPDGRSNLVLKFVGAALIQEELPLTEPFRRFRCRLLYPKGDPGEHAGTIRSLLMQWALSHPDTSPEVERLLALPASAMVDQLAGQVFELPSERRRYLAETNLDARGRDVESRLSEMMLEGRG